MIHRPDYFKFGSHGFAKGYLAYNCKWITDLVLLHQGTWSAFCVMEQQTQRPCRCHFWRKSQMVSLMSTKLAAVGLRWFIRGSLRLEL